MKLDLNSLRNFDELPDTFYVRMPLLLSILSISESTIYRLMKENKFPKAVNLSARTRAWSLGEIRKFIADKNNK